MNLTGNVAAEGVGSAEVVDAARVRYRELQEGVGQVGHVDGAADVVREQGADAGPAASSCTVRSCSDCPPPMISEVHATTLSAYSRRTPVSAAPSPLRRG